MATLQTIISGEREDEAQWGGTEPLCGSSISLYPRGVLGDENKYQKRVRLD